MVTLKKILSWILPVTVKNVRGEVTQVLEVTFENGKKVLNAGQVNYSFGSLHDVFRRALKMAKVKEHPPEDVLVLGLGAGSIVSILVEEQHLDPKMVGVEADPEVVRLGKEEFGMGRFGKLEIRTETAEKFIAEDQRQFDLVAVDVFVESKVPESCKSEEFLRGLYNHLRKGGKVVFNKMIHSEFTANLFAERFSSVFDETEIYQMRRGDAANKILIGYRKN